MNSLKDFALESDRSDTLAGFREQFLFPKDSLYFAGNSLGLQPVKVRQYITEELEDWAKFGVEGHFEARHPWLPYHEFLTESLARLVGAKPIEVVAMNTLTVNLHLMMTTFYRPTPKRFKILVEAGAFPSDQYAVQSQAKLHGFDPKSAILELTPKPGENFLNTEDILEVIRKQGHEIALVMIGNVNYRTGQAFPMKLITEAAHREGCQVGFDLAHGAGNLELSLHDDGPDFAVWCSYKYLNAGPGALAGCFVHERHANAPDLPRFSGWWGHNKTTRFKMGPDFSPIPGAEGWQLSNPPIFQLAALRASLELFDQAGMPRLREKSVKLTAYLEKLLDTELASQCEILTPRIPTERGCQLSIRITKGDPKKLLADLQKHHTFCDFREPDVIRVAPVPLYTQFMDVYQLVSQMKELLAK
jgi:kynureninase